MATGRQEDDSPDVNRGANRKLNHLYANVSQSLPALNMNLNRSVESKPQVNHDGAVQIGPPVEYNAL